MLAHDPHFVGVLCAELISSQSFYLPSLIVFAVLTSLVFLLMSVQRNSKTADVDTILFPP